MNLHSIKFASKKFFSVFVFLILFACSTFAESYRIASTEYSINGITREKILAHKLQINFRKIFNDQASLENYIEDVKKKTQNLRIFDTIEISYLVSPIKEEDITPVTLRINVTDTKHLIIIPYYKYDSNDGHVIKGKLRDSNFLGTINQMETDLYFAFEQKDESKPVDFKLGTAFNYDFPFYIGPVYAEWLNSIDLSYIIGKNQPEWNVSTGLKLSYELDRISFDLLLKQKAVNDFDQITRNYDNALYFGEEAEFSTPIKLEQIDNWGDILYTPGVSFVYNWNFKGIDARNDELTSPELLLFNKISTKRVDWKGNFRSGIDAYIKQATGYNFLNKNMVVGFETEFMGFIAGKYVGFNSRVYGFAYANKNIKIGHRIRGIKDDAYFNPITGKDDIFCSSTPGALVVNLELPIRLFETDWEKIGWNFLRNFNFELQIVPFIDFALFSNRATGRTFSLKDGFYTAGIEVIVFPKRWKTLQIRASAGFDIGRLLLKDWIDTSWRPNVSKHEFSFGIGLLY